MASYILDKAYAAADDDGIGACRVVVQGDNPGEAKLPTEANAGAILGVSVHSQPLRGANIAVRKAGIARVLAAAPIRVGAPVNIADTSGRVKEVDEDTGAKVNCLGFAETAADNENDLVEVFIALHERTI